MMTLQAEVVNKSLYGSAAGHSMCASSEMTGVDMAMHQHHSHQANQHLPNSSQASPGSAAAAAASLAAAVSLSQREALQQCLSTSSLHALQNLQPWGGGAVPISMHSNIERVFPLSTTTLC